MAVGEKERAYIAIDLKSFYASVECVDRGLDPLTTNLVVADVSRTEKTICLAVSPSLKARGIGGRARLFEVVEKLRLINYERLIKTPNRRLTRKSTSDIELKKHLDWEVDYIAAQPRMARYIEVSTKIFSIYLKYVSAEDIHVYSIDEVFIDVTTYLSAYKMTPHELAMTMIQDVLRETGITATAGIGTNLYLCKVAMDIVAKHIPADKDGVRIAELDEMTYRQKLWDHVPLTDFWRVGRGIVNRLRKIGISTMGDIARLSIKNEEILYKMFGINAELLIDHAWGWEPCTIDYIKSYKPKVNSLSSGQVLHCPYTFEKALIVVKEMAEAISLDLVEKRLVTDQIGLYVGYDNSSLADAKIFANYRGPLGVDHYGRRVPMPATGSINLGNLTSSSRLIIDATVKLFHAIADPTLLIRRITLTTNHVVREAEALKAEQAPRQLSLFVDNEAVERQRDALKAENERERKFQEAIIGIRNKYGKNALLRGLDFSDGATARDRNAQIGGHKA